MPTHRPCSLPQTVLGLPPLPGGVPLLMEFNPTRRLLPAPTVTLPVTCTISYPEGLGELQPGVVFGGTQPSEQYPPAPSPPALRWDPPAPQDP